MAENSRKCIKCGHSPGVDPDTKLFRYPKPGKTNILRCELWAKYCFPDGEWSSQEFQQKLHREHRMLCHRHFKRTSFSDYPHSTKKLHRFAVPDEEMTIFVPQPKPLNVVPLQDKTNVFTGVDNPTKIMQPTEENEIKLCLLNQPSNSRSLVEGKRPEVKQPLDENVQIPVSSKKTAREKYLYNKCRKHMKRICQLRNRINKLKNKEYLREISNNDSVQELMKKLTPTFALLLQAQIKNFSRKSKGRRWTPEEKIIALRLYKRSPTCYRLMRRVMCLPAQSSLRTLLGQFEMNVGINNNIFSILAKFSKLQKPSDNEYILLFDEMSIKKNLRYNRKSDIIEGFQDHGHQGRSPHIASNALVFMVAGIRKKVKQPVAFYLSSGYVTADRLAALIKEVLRECYRAGLNIAATVCDMDGVNRRALGILGATVDRPSINVDDKDIVSIFDPPHLLKCFRNLLMKYDMKCNNDIKSSNNRGIGIAKWSHIIKFYELDSSNPNFVFAPALKQEHLNPNTKQKMRVKLAAQVFSHTVAAGMMAKISQGELTTDAITTLHVIENIDKLFDSLNSDSSDLRRGKIFATNIKNSSPHLQFFREMRTFFKSIEFIGCNRAPPSKEGWIWTLNAIQLLWEKITSKHSDVKSLATRRLQQDPLENLFGCIRGNCGANVNPTAGQFVAALKTTILSNLEHITTGNCESDNNDSIIDNYKMLLSKTPTNICTEASTSSSQNVSNFSDMIDEFETFCDTEIDNEDSGEMQACAYVCGFLIKNLCNDACEKCKTIFIASEKSQVHLFSQCKEYNELKSRLNYCTKELIKYIECCSKEVNKILQDKGHECYIKSNVLATLVIINDEFLRICPLHFRKNKNYLLNSVFHICVNRFCVLKNRVLQEEASKIALKKKIDLLKHI